MKLAIRLARVANDCAPPFVVYTWVWLLAPIFVACALAPVHPPATERVTVRDLGIDWVTEYHHMPSPGFDLRTYTVRVCEVCRGDKCERVQVVPARNPCTPETVKQ